MGGRRFAELIGLFARALFALVIAVGIGAEAVASYVNTCILRGEVASEPVVGKHEVRFKFKVGLSGKSRNERSDSGCDSRGRTIEVRLAFDDAAPAIRKGQTLWIRDWSKDDGVKPVRDFVLLSEADGLAAISPASE